MQRAAFQPTGNYPALCNWQQSRKEKKKKTGEKGKKKMKSILADEFLSLFKLALNQAEKCPRYRNRGKQGSIQRLPSFNFYFILYYPAPFDTLPYKNSFSSYQGHGEQTVETLNTAASDTSINWPNKNESLRLRNECLLHRQRSRARWEIDEQFTYESEVRTNKDFPFLTHKTHLAYNQKDEEKQKNGFKNLKAKGRSLYCETGSFQVPELFT